MFYFPKSYRVERVCRKDDVIMTLKGIWNGLTLISMTFTLPDKNSVLVYWCIGIKLANNTSTDGDNKAIWVVILLILTMHLCLTNKT